MFTPPPQISIILPTFNVEDYIAQALLSCINQSYKNIEIIVVDDCGSDRSIEIAYEFAKGDSRIKIIHNPKNLNLFKTREVGAKAANGEWILFLDADDVLDLDICQIFVNTIYRYSEVELDFIACNMALLSNDNTLQTREAYQKNKIYDIQAYLSHIVYWNLCGNLLKKDKYLLVHQKLQDCPSFMMAEDALLFFFYLTCIQNNIATSRHCLYYYRTNPTSATRTLNAKMAQQYIQDHDIAIRYINNYIQPLSDCAIKEYGEKICQKLEQAKNGQKLRYWQKFCGFPLREYAYIISISTRSIEILRLICLKIKILMS